MYGDAQSIYAAELAGIREAGLEKVERAIVGPRGPQVSLDGAGAPPRKVLSFCANDYLGLATDPRVLAAAHRGLDASGYGLASVRFICGTQADHLSLEHALARFVGMDAAILYSSCFDANGGLFETLLGEDDAIISDALNHASIIDGIRLCRATRHRYAHSDMGALERALQETTDRRLRMIATDGVFSMDGDVAHLQAICDLADRYRALVMVDDSHATGVLGPTGRGSIEHCGVAGRVDVVTSTLGKALGGASGGFVAGRAELVALLRQRSRPYLFSNTLAPAVVSATLAVLEILSGDSAPREALLERARRFRESMSAAGFRLAPGSHPIVPILMSGPRAQGGGDARLAHDFSEGALAHGIHVVPFSYPVVPVGQARVRVQLSAAHTPEMVDAAVATFTTVGQSLGMV